MAEMAAKNFIVNEGMYSKGGEMKVEYAIRIKGK
jgi:hypothetical protein